MKNSVGTRSKERKGKAMRSLILASLAVTVILAATLGCAAFPKPDTGLDPEATRVAFAIDRCNNLAENSCGGAYWQREDCVESTVRLCLEGKTPRQRY